MQLLLVDVERVSDRLKYFVVVVYFMIGSRYIIHSEDRVADMERRVEELTKETNEKLRDAEITEASLLFREPSVVIKDKRYYNGFIGIRVRLDRKPDFLNDQDKESWYTKVRSIAESHFGFDPNIGGRDLDYISIGFEEDSEEKLYTLTEKKEIVFRKGFENVRQFCNFYNSAVIGYSVVVNAHRRRLWELLIDLNS